MHRKQAHKTERYWHKTFRHKIKTSVSLQLIWLKFTRWQSFFKRCFQYGVWQYKCSCVRPLRTHRTSTTVLSRWLWNIALPPVWIRTQRAFSCKATFSEWTFLVVLTALLLETTTIKIQNTMKTKCSAGNQNKPPVLGRQRLPDSILIYHLQSAESCTEWKLEWHSSRGKETATRQGSERQIKRTRSKVGVTETSYKDKSKVGVTEISYKE